MKTFQYRFGGSLLTLRLDERNGSVGEILLDGVAPLPAESEMPAYAAAIALALIEHEVAVVHDEEPGIITVKRYATDWNDPAAQMNSLN